MKKVICFGEALIDLLSNKLGKESGSSEQFTKFAGGAPANVAVAAAKLGANAYFCGMLGDDSFGHFLKQELRQHGVRTDYVRFTTEAKTALAFVSLDDSGERSFEFYRHPGADMLFTQAHFDQAWFHDDGIFHICSNSLTDQGIFTATKQGVACANAANWLVSFDVNLRLNLWPELSHCRPRVAALIEHADIVKMSVEELDYLRAEQSAGGYLKHILRGRPELILVTDGGKPMKWYGKDNQGVAYPPNITMVDATAAGDAFVGGLLYQLARSSLSLNALVNDGLALEPLLAFACACGAHAASKTGAFPSLPTSADIQHLTGA